MIDSVCNMFNWIVQFAFARDPEANLTFVKLQSEAG